MKRVMLIDLWVGPGHAYYTGPLVAALARREDIELGFMHNRRQDLRLYPGDYRRFPMDSPTGLGRGEWGRVLLQPVEFSRAMRAIQSFNPDVVHIVFTHPWFSAALPLLARRRAWVCTLHDVTPHHGEDTFRNRLGIRSAVRHARALVVHGPHSLAEARGLHPQAAERFHSIPHGHFGCLREGLEERLASTAMEPATFLFFGRMLPYKGLGIALRAFGRVLTERRGARLIIAGPGEVGADDRAEIERLGKAGADIEFLNRRISDPEMAILMARSLAVLAPYTHASGSGVAAAASAFERPLIASRLGGLIDMIDDGETGWMFETGNEAELAAIMLRAMDDPGAAGAMGGDARLRATDRGDWDRIAGTLAGIYAAAG